MRCIIKSILQLKKHKLNKKTKENLKHLRNLKIVIEMCSHAKVWGWGMSSQRYICPVGKTSVYQVDLTQCQEELLKEVSLGKSFAFE